MHKGFMRGLLTVSIISSVASGIVFGNGINSKADNIKTNKYINSTTANINETKITDVNNYNIYYGLLHSHSDFSDGEGTCEEAFQYASTQAKQLDFFAVTDHSNSFDNQKYANIFNGSASTEWQEGHRLAQKYTTANFIGLYGYEMTWQNGVGHINTLNTPGFQSRKQAGYTDATDCLQNYYKTLQTVPNSVNIFNHPSTKWGHFNDFAYYDVNTDNVMNLLELGGYHKLTKSFTEYCNYYNRALDKGWHVSPANNQDNHKKQWGTENPRRTVILANSLSEANIYDAAKNNRTYATEDYDFKLKYTLDNYLMGSKVNINSVGNTVKINVNMTDPSDSTIGTVEVVVNGGKTIATSKASGQTANVEFTVPTDYSYYYVRIMQPDGDRIVSAPVWLGNYKVKTNGGEATPKPAVTTAPTTTPVQPTATVQPAVTSNTNNTITYSNTNNNTSTTNNSSNTTYTTTNSNNTTCTTNNNTCTTTDTNNAEITEDTYNGTQEQMDSSVVVPEITSTTDTTVQTNSTSQLDTSPKTGDEQGLQIWFIIMAVSLGMTIVGGFTLYKNR